VTHGSASIGYKRRDNRGLPMITPMLVSWSWKAQDIRQPTVSLMSAMQCTFRSC